MQAAFFDLDKTIVCRSSSLALSRPLYRAGMVSRGQLLRGAYAQLVYLLVGADEQKMERLKDGMLQLTKGWDRAEVERLVEDVLLDVIDPFVYQEALDLIEQHRAEGRRIYIVSSSPEEIVRPLARHFGVERRDRHQGAGRPRGPVHGRARVLRVRRGEGRGHPPAGRQRSGSTSRGPTPTRTRITDVPMLEVVGNPVAVNPDRELRQVAEERGWEVREFRNPVRLRTRLASAVPPARTSLVAAAVGVAACRRRPRVGHAALARRPPRPRVRRRLSDCAASGAGCSVGCGCREVPARGAEPTRESRRGRHAPGPGTMVPAPGACAGKRLIPAPLASCPDPNVNPA